MRRKGVTLIELICFIGLLGILCGMILPSSQRARGDNRLRLAVDQLISDLRYSKAYAVTHPEQSIVVSFTPIGNPSYFTGYLLRNKDILTSRNLILRSFEEGIAVDCDHSTLPVNQGAIEFLSNGSVNPACTIALRDLLTGTLKKITLTIGYTRIQAKE